MTSWSSSPEHARIEPTVRAAPDLSEFADAVLHQGQSLMVWRPANVLLLGLAQSLQAHWQSQWPDMAITHFSGQQPANLLGQINEKLSQQNLRQLTPPGPALAPEGIWFVHDAECLSADELFLLLRLNAHFPGWTIRWVLLLNASTPLSPDKQTLLNQDMKHWLKWQIDGADHRPAPPALTSLPVVPGQAPATWALVPQPQIRRTAITPQPYKTAAIGLLMALLLGAGLLLMWPASPPGERPAAGLTGSALSNPTPALGPATGTPTPPTAETQATHAVTGSESMPREPAAPTPAKPAAPTSAPDRLPGWAASDTTTTPSTTTPSLATPQRVAMPDVAIRGHRWLAGLPKESFVLEHGVFESAQQAQRLIKAQAELANARIVMLQSLKGAPARYLVVTGPFRSQERAQNFKARQQLPPQTHIEEVSRVLQQSLAPSPREAQARP